jgi:hypothetical protein
MYILYNFSFYHGLVEIILMWLIICYVLQLIICLINIIGVYLDIFLIIIVIIWGTVHFIIEGLT